MVANSHLSAHVDQAMVECFIWHPGRSFNCLRDVEAQFDACLGNTQPTHGWLLPCKRNIDGAKGVRLGCVGTNIFFICIGSVTLGRALVLYSATTLMESKSPSDVFGCVGRSKKHNVGACTAEDAKDCMQWDTAASSRDASKDDLLFHDPLLGYSLMIRLPWH